MTEPLRALRTPADLHDAITEATELHPDDPGEAVQWILDTFAMDPAVAASLAIQGQREIGRLN